MRTSKRAQADMANNPKKVKDPTEVALSAIQEALNISDANTDTNRGSARAEMVPPMPPTPPTFNEPTFNEPTFNEPAFNEPAFEAPARADRPMFEPIEEPRPARRPANDDRETIGQILQAIQKGRPARNVYTLATLFTAVWIAGARLLTVSFLPSIQAAVGQGSGGVLVLGGLAALFFD